MMNELEHSRVVTLDEAKRFVALQQRAAVTTSIAVFLCMLSPIALLLLAAGQESGVFGIREEVAAAVGICILLVIVAIACGMFVYCGAQSKRYEYLEKEPFTAEPNVISFVRERQESMHSQHTLEQILGVVFCVLSAIPTVLMVVISRENDFSAVIGVCLTLVVAGIGVIFFVHSGMNWACMEKLLQEGDYAVSKKDEPELFKAVKSALWAVIVAGYLLYSFATGNWGTSWIVFPVAGILFGAVSGIYAAARRG